MCKCTRERNGNADDAGVKLEQLRLILAAGLDVLETFNVMVAVILAPPTQ